MLRPPLDRWYVWYLDPLDGTTNFAHAYPAFRGVAGARRGHGDLSSAIVHDPIRDETFVAERGRGATLNDEPIAVSSGPALDDALLATGFPYDRREHLDLYLGFFADFVRRAQGVRRNGSAALDLCYVGVRSARRRSGSGSSVRGIRRPAMLVAAKLRGAVSDFRGAPFDLFGSQTLASNGRLHACHGPRPDRPPGGD